MLKLTTIMFFVWVIAQILAIWTTRIAQVMANRWPRVAARPLGNAFPKVAVILPVKGKDDETRQNVEALLHQQYPDYRLLFAVESEDDPVIPLLDELAGQNPTVQMAVVIAGQATTSGQKIHNQLAAVDHTAAEDTVLAFLDADARPNPTWLHALVTPLTYGPHIGASTGYRFYVPTTSHPANAIVSVINAGVAALFGPFRRTFAWGGSMAIRRADFFGYRIHQMWQTSLSDDYVLSSCVRDIGRAKIAFVPQCLVASEASFGWHSLFEFAVRQYRITRICIPIVWVCAVLGPTLYLSALAYALSMAIRTTLLEHPNWWHFVLMSAGLITCTLVRGMYLLRAAKRMLPAHYHVIRRSTFYFSLGFPLVQAFNLITLLAAAFGNRITWRGISYTMVSKTRTIVHPRATAQPAAIATPEPTPAHAGA